MLDFGNVKIRLILNMCKIISPDYWLKIRPLTGKYLSIDYQEQGWCQKITSSSKFPSKVRIGTVTNSTHKRTDHRRGEIFL